MKRERESQSQSTRRHNPVDSFELVHHVCQRSSSHGRRIPQMKICCDARIPFRINFHHFCESSCWLNSFWRGIYIYTDCAQSTQHTTHVWWSVFIDVWPFVCHACIPFNPFNILKLNVLRGCCTSCVYSLRKEKLLLWYGRKERQWNALAENQSGEVYQNIVSHPLFAVQPKCNGSGRAGYGKTWNEC